MKEISIRGNPYRIADGPVDIEIPEYGILIKDTVLGNGVVIWSNVNIYGAKIGDYTKIGAYVEIRKGVVIGKNVKIEPFVFIPEGVYIEDCVFIGPNVIFTNDIWPRACDENDKLKQEYEIINTYVKKGASIGAGSVIRCGIVIGENSMIGMGSVVTKDVAPNSLVYGTSAKFRKEIDI